MKQDMIFGVLHTALTLGITLFFARFIKSKIILMFINTVAFSFNMFIIAFMLKVFAKLPEAFMFLLVSSCLSEFITLILCILIMYYLINILIFGLLFYYLFTYLFFIYIFSFIKL